MNLTDMTIEEMCTTTEKQLFDRKSAKIDATTIATPMIEFANADGGLLAVGIEDNGEITGIDAYTKNINEILRAGYDFCRPSIFIEKEMIDCIDSKGNPNHILLIKIPQSADMHANHRDEVYLRVGDKSKKLSFEERMELMYSKGMRFYEDEPVYRSSLDDIDMDFVAEYCKKIGYGKTPEEYMKQNKDYIVNIAGRQEMSGAAIMMFGKEPQRFFPRSRVRFIRYEGTEAKVGAEMNVIKDKIFEGRILELVEQTIEYVRTQIKEHTYLGPDARFVTEPEYPEFAWKEIIVNAIAHRDYSIKGTDIQIKMFDDHITVESPGTLPGTVRLNNMREIGLPDPEYKTVAFMVHVTIRNKKYLMGKNNIAQEIAQENTQEVAQEIFDKDSVEGQIVVLLIENPRITRKEIASKLGITTDVVKYRLDKLRKTGRIRHEGPTKSGKWIVNNK